MSKSQRVIIYLELSSYNTPTQHTLTTVFHRWSIRDQLSATLAAYSVVVLWYYDYFMISISYAAEITRKVKTNMLTRFNMQIERLYDRSSSAIRLSLSIRWLCLIVVGNNLTDCFSSYDWCSFNVLIACLLSILNYVENDFSSIQSCKFNKLLTV